MEPSFDFTKYTFDELLDAARHIDAAAHPQRAAALSGEIDRRIRAGDLLFFRPNMASTRRALSIAAGPSSPRPATSPKSSSGASAPARSR